VARLLQRLKKGTFSPTLSNAKTPQHYLSEIPKQEVSPLPVTRINGVNLSKNSSTTLIAYLFLGKQDTFFPIFIWRFRLFYVFLHTKF
jgi:hypothetical protein